MATLSTALALTSRYGFSTERATGQMDKMMRKMPLFCITINSQKTVMDPVINQYSRQSTVMKTVTNQFSSQKTVVNAVANQYEAAAQKSETFNTQLEKTESRAAKAGAAAKKLFHSFAGMDKLQKGMEMTDRFMGASARLSAVNDGNQTQRQLNDHVFAAADRSGTGYSDMVDSVTAIGAFGGGFSSSAELVGFTELLRKSLKVSGADSSDQDAAFEKVAGAMGSGTLDGDAFGALVQSAPLAAEAISGYMGVAEGDLQRLAGEGAITADILKNALMASSDEINGKFSEMPKTFAGMGTLISNHLQQAFGPVFENLSGFLNSGGVSVILDVLSSGIDKAAGAVNWLVESIMAGDPLVKGFFMAAVLMAGIWAVSMLIAAVSSMAALLPFILIVAAIALVIAGLNSMGVTFSTIFGFIGGLLGMTYAVVYNVIGGIWNHMIAFAEFLANFANDPMAAIVNLFVNMATSVLGIISDIAKAIDGVFGTNLADVVETSSNSLQAWGDSFKTKDYVSYEDMRMDTKDITKTQQEWSGKGSEIGTFFDEWDFNGEGGLTGLFKDFKNPVADAPFGAPSSPVTVEGTGRNNAVEVDMSEEDIQYMRDIAQREYVAKIATNTLAPNIRIDFTGPVTKEADVNRVAAHLGGILRDEIACAAEGVY